MAIKPFYDLVNWSYHTVMDRMPQSLRERDMASAFALGGTGSYVATRIALLGLRLAVNMVNPESERWVPLLLMAGASALPTVTFLYGVRNPRGIKETVTEHPTYTSGMLGAYLGGLAATIQYIKLFS